MNVIRLKPDFYGDIAIEGYSSMIWTERYMDHGEFEMRTPHVEDMRVKIPEDSLISLQDSREVMIVETHEIQRNEDGAIELVIKGRSFEVVLEDRFVALGVYRKPWVMQDTYSALEAAMVLAWNVLCNNTTGPVRDVTRTELYGRDPRENIPNLAMTMSVAVDTANEAWWLEAGQIYPKFLDFLVRHNGGVRMVRPPWEPVYPAFEATVLYSGEIVALSSGTHPTWMKMDFYNGLDRSLGQTARPQLIFSYNAGHLENPKYLFSIRGLKNICRVDTNIGNVQVYADEGSDPYLTGRNRRMIHVDGGEVGDQDQTAFIAAMVQKGEIELRKYNRTALMEASVSANAPYKYGRDYFLGDQVTLQGEFGFNQKMQVNEYVRTEDSDGERGFPMLTLPPTFS